jgi:hypothetical protein
VKFVYWLRSAEIGSLHEEFVLFLKFTLHAILFYRINLTKHSSILYAYKSFFIIKEFHVNWYKQHVCDQIIIIPIVQLCE